VATAFQPNAFQSNAFQEHGGAVTSDITIGINATQGGDTGSLTVNLVGANTVGAPGPRRQRYVIFIDGKRFIGYREEIYAVLERLAEEDAKPVFEGKKPAKRRIVVQQGKEQRIETGVQSPAIVLHDFTAIQTDFRRVYLAQLAHELLELERDDEEILLLL
jgi:hypothetical protein